MKTQIPQGHQVWCHYQKPSENPADNVETLTDLVYRKEENIQNEKFIFSPDVKRIKVDIGLSNSGNFGCNWLMDTRDDLGVIGIEANPICQQNLLVGGTTNSYITCLCLEFNKICRFLGLVSEVYIKDTLAQQVSIEELTLSGHLLNKNGAADLAYLDLPRDLILAPTAGGSIRISPKLIWDDAGVFRFLPVLAELKDIAGKYILIHGAVDDVGDSMEPTYQQFYSMRPNIGASSLRFDVAGSSARGGANKQVIADTFDVPSYSLDKILDYVDWDKFPYIECIKIDVEGKELDVLRSCKKYMEKVVYFRIEAFKCTDPDNPPFTSDLELIPFMKEHGFELFDEEPGDYKFVNTRYKKRIDQQRLINPLSW